ncbi:hypothetical protein KNP414_00901 [Paenibacillus mucilaginosus KNP414]|uniref:Uncharacterized protein n=1 Tax=Paenibacillus mucilaginosus (strain KNP414) TaxID=1036673 RepID=F8F7K6_PAEMK|nr:hypothetical protein KNP414_00901 [Paenibacillus mucilaginosus KNP414]
MDHSLCRCLRHDFYGESPCSWGGPFAPPIFSSSWHGCFPIPGGLLISIPRGCSPVPRGPFLPRTLRAISCTKPKGYLPPKSPYRGTPKGSGPLDSRKGWRGRDGYALTVRCAWIALSLSGTRFTSAGGFSPIPWGPRNLQAGYLNP